VEGEVLGCQAARRAAILIENLSALRISASVAIGLCGARARRHPGGQRDRAACNSYLLDRMQHISMQSRRNQAGEHEQNTSRDQTIGQRHLGAPNRRAHAPRDKRVGSTNSKVM
jgi:hypothetical protein